MDTMYTSEHNRYVTVTHFIPKDIIMLLIVMGGPFTRYWIIGESLWLQGLVLLVNSFTPNGTNYFLL